MLSSKLFILLENISRTELKDFGFYLKCFHSKQKVLLNTFDYLQKYHPDFRLKKKLEAGYAYQKIFGKTLVSESNRRNLFNTLGEIKKYLEDFLLWADQKKDSNREKALMDLFRERRLDTFYHTYFEKVKKRLEQDENSDMWNDLRRFQTSFYRYFYKNTDKYNIRASSLLEITGHLNAFWVNATLKFACELAFLSGVLMEKIKLPLLEEAKKMSRNHPYSENIFNQIHLLLLDLYESENFPNYLKVKGLIFDHYHKAEPGEQSLYYGYLLNYVAKQLKKGRFLYKKESLEIFKFGLESKLILEDGKISSIGFNNIIKTACDLKDLDFAKMALVKYKNHLAEKIREDALKIAEAMILLEEEKYDDALYILNTGEYHPIDLGIRYRAYKLQCLYEKKNFEFLISHLNAFDVWIRRNNKKLGKSNTAACKNLIKLTRKLAKPNEDGRALKAELDAVPFIFMKSWMIQKVEELN